MEGADYVRSVMRPLAPIPTGVEPRLPELEGISTVVFDVYGTLLVSAAGDIGMPGKDEAGCEAIAEVNAFLKEGCQGAEKVRAPELARLLDDALSRKRARGVQFPEIDIRTIWKDILERVAPAHGDGVVDAAALRYECAMNPVWEMSGSVALIRSLAQKGIKLGIISNAQDYTHSVFAGVMEGSFEALGFAPSLGVFSYLHGEGKPSLTLFQEMKERLSDCGVTPESVLYVGNDMIKDVIPAAAMGFRTCLFAGDDRSLRLGDLSEDEASEIADAVVTSMSQIIDLLK
jgi:putative hydrolase of the HAD superfamily